MKRILFILLLVGSTFATHAQNKVKFNVAVRKDTLDTDRSDDAPKGFFGKVFNTIRTVKEVIGDPSKLMISLEDKQGNKESLKDYLRKKGPLKSKESYVPGYDKLNEVLVAWRKENTGVAEEQTS
ncbi:MAG: hypothetical protein U0Y10_13160 [Spirosomataceae bacterium]